MEYLYNNDIIDSMIAIDGDFPITYTLILNKYSSNIRSARIKITDKELIIYPSIDKNIDYSDNINIIRIKIDDIEYFKEEGEVYREQKISGGGSGNINVAGAIVGDIIAGAPGMILGGQRKVEEIKSETITHDTREVKLVYFINKNKKIRSEITFSNSILQFFKDNIPEKEYSVYEINRQKNLIVNPDKKSSKKDRIKELNELLNEGLISEEEYNNKKQKILDEL